MSVRFLRAQSNSQVPKQLGKSFVTISVMYNSKFVTHNSFIYSNIRNVLTSDASDVMCSRIKCPVLWSGPSFSSTLSHCIEVTKEDHHGPGFIFLLEHKN